MARTMVGTMVSTMVGTMVSTIRNPKSRVFFYFFIHNMVIVDYIYVQRVFNYQYFAKKTRKKGLITDSISSDQ